MELLKSQLLAIRFQLLVSNCQLALAAIKSKSSTPFFLADAASRGDKKAGS
jgi:hypothetical protein